MDRPGRGRIVCVGYTRRLANFPDVSRCEAAAGTVHHEQSVRILSRLDSPCFAKLIKSLVGVVVQGPDVGLVTVELILSSIL